MALSGGKDSLALMLELSRQGYDVTGLHIDLGIPGSSQAARAVVERFCERHGLRLMVKDMTAEGLPIPLVKERLKPPRLLGLRQDKASLLQQGRAGRRL